MPRKPAAPPLPMMPDSCRGRGSSTNGSTGSVGGFIFETWLPAVGKSAGRGRLQLAGRRHAVRRIAGQHLVDRRRVIEQPVRRVAHRPDQRALVQRVGHHRHRFADVRARNLRLDRLEVAANVGGASGFGSQMSMWLGPPWRKMNTTDLALPNPRAPSNFGFACRGLLPREETARDSVRKFRASQHASSSRRVGPSQVLHVRPGITSMAILPP